MQLAVTKVDSTWFEKSEQAREKSIEIGGMIFVLKSSLTLT